MRGFDAPRPPLPPLEDFARELTRLTFRDLQRFGEAFDAKNDQSRSTAARLLATADAILAGDAT